MSRQPSAVYEWGTIGICAVAGAWTLFHIIWALQGQTADDFWGQALLVLFVLALILAFARFVQERSALTATASQEEFPEPPISKFFLATSGAAALWFTAPSSKDGARTGLRLDPYAGFGVAGATLRGAF